MDYWITNTCITLIGNQMTPYCMGYWMLCSLDKDSTHSSWKALSRQVFHFRLLIQPWMSSVPVLAGEVLCSLGSILHPCPLAYPSCTVEDLIPKRNPLQVVFFLGDLGNNAAGILFSIVSLLQSYYYSTLLTIFSYSQTWPCNDTT